MARLCVDIEASIGVTMRAIDEGGCELALVIATDGTLFGTATDGDIRRALLAGASMDDPIAPFARRDYTCVTPAFDRASVLDLMHARLINQVPVVDADNRAIGLHLLHDLVAPVQHSNPAVIMAGGKGTRLRPITEHIPKPMVTVAGRPILERIILLVGSGISQIFVSVNYMADAIADHFGDGEQFGCEIEYLREETENPLGTAGALRLLPAEVRDGTDAVVVMNGDLVTQFDVTALLSAHTLGGFAATVGARDHSHSIPFGVLDTRAGDVIGIEEKPTASWLVNAGIYAVDPSLIADVPADVEYPITELLAHAMRTERRVGAHRIDGDWIDVGRHDELRRARGMEA